MNPQIRLLVRLQKIAFSIFELDQRRKAGPARLQELEDLFQRTVEDIGAARLRYETLESERRQLESSIEELDIKLEKYQQQLMSVTNAREYSAALNEIDAAKTSRERAEVGIEVRSTEELELADAVTEADSRIAEARATTDTEKETILAELSEVHARLEQLIHEQSEVETVLEDDLVHQFKRVFSARGGVAMASIDNGACSACHLRLRPQVVNEVRRGENLVPCDSCRRFLFVEEPKEEKGEDGSEPGESSGSGEGSGSLEASGDTPEIPQEAAGLAESEDPSESESLLATDDTPLPPTEGSTTAQTS